MFNEARTKIPCRMCIKLKAIKNRVPDCSKCKPYPYTICIDENLDFMYIFKKYSNILNNGMGGVNADAFRLIFELEDIDRNEFINKFNIFHSAAMEQKR